MEDFFKSVLSTLSFLLLLFFCFFSDSLNAEPPRPAPEAGSQFIKSVKFKQAPAIVNLEGDTNENQFNWQN